MNTIINDFTRLLDNTAIDLSKMVYEESKDNDDVFYAIAYEKAERFVEEFLKKSEFTFIDKFKFNDFLADLITTKCFEIHKRIEND